MEMCVLQDQQQSEGSVAEVVVLHLLNGSGQHSEVECRHHKVREAKQL